MPIGMLPAILLLTAPLAGAGREQVALLPLVTSGLAADQIVQVGATVQRAVDAHFAPRSIGAAAVRERLEKSGAMGLRCDRTDPSCSAQLGAVCEADVVLVATFSHEKGKSALSFRLVDVAEATQLAHAHGEVGADPAVDDVRAILERLSSPDATGTRVTLSGPAGAPVVVDGAARGALPLAPITDLAPGSHAIAIGDFAATVDVRRGEPIAVAAPIVAAEAAAPAPVAGPPEPRPASNVPLIVTAAGGGAVVVGAIAVVAGVTPLLAHNQGVANLNAIQLRAEQDPSTLDDDVVRAEYARVDENAKAWNSWGVIAATSGAVVGVAGLVAAGAGAYLFIAE